MGAEQLVMSGTQWPSRVLEPGKSGWVLSWLEQSGGEPEGLVCLLENFVGKGSAGHYKQGIPRK